MDKLNTIYQPVFEELEGIKSIIKYHVMAMQEIRQYIEPYFNAKAKYMRSFLSFMCANMMLNGKIDNCTMNKLFDFAICVELMHTASLVHDEVSLNIKYGSQTTVILGDMIYTKALQILNNSFNTKVSGHLLEILNKICYGQFIEKTRNNPDKEAYINMIKMKTGLLMGFSCKGIFYACDSFNNRNHSEKIYNFGVYSGILYQMIDDMIDKDIDSKIEANDVEIIKKLAEDEIKIFPDSIYKAKLMEFLDFLFNFQTGRVC